MDKGHKILMISLQIRHYAATVQAQTGQSIQDILRDFVAAARDGFIAFGAQNLCTVCGSKQTRITITRRNETVITRTHRCDFCSNVFRSEEKTLPIQRLEEDHKPIASKRKKPHSKNRKS